MPVSAISEKRGVTIHTDLLNADAPANCAPEVVEALSQACKKQS